MTHAGVIQDARPTASDVRTFPAHGVPHVIFTCPATSSFAHGVTVPIPTFPVFVFEILPPHHVHEYCVSKLPVRVEPPVFR